jgi:hypothetical protein
MFTGGEMLDCDLEMPCEEPLIYEKCCDCLIEMEWNKYKHQFECLLCEKIFSFYIDELDQEYFEVTYE